MENEKTPLLKNAKKLDEVVVKIPINKLYDDDIYG